MARRDLLIFALGVIRDECYRHGTCNSCPFYNSKENTGCGIQRNSPENWYIPDDSDEEIEPIDI